MQYNLAEYTEEQIQQWDIDMIERDGEYIDISKTELCSNAKEREQKAIVNYRLLEVIYYRY